MYEQTPAEKEAYLERNIAEYQRRLCGPRFVGASLSRIPAEVPGIVEKLSAFLNNSRNMLLFHGSPGIGKTYFCAGLIEYAARKYPHSFRYFTERELLTRLRTCISEGHGDYLYELEKYAEADFVILDDIGSNINPQHVTYKDHEWKREIFFTFLDIRYNLQMPTVITSNFTRDDFKEIYSERICSRLFAKENTVISLFGPEHDKRAQGL